MVNTKTLELQNVLTDKSFLAPLDFDCAGRFWLRRDQSTVEAWDALLSRAVSRHRLKGDIMGSHRDEGGALCVVTWHRKEKILRVYRIN